MAFKTLVSPSLTDLFVEELIRMILNQTLKIGEKLPPERQMADEMNVSLAVVNGGITRLTSRGFLRVVPRKGVFVADYIREGNIFTLTDIMNFRGTTFCEDILEPLIAFRRSIESAAVLKACENRTKEHLKHMEELLSAMSDPQNTKNAAELRFAFQHEFTIASGNLYYPMMLQTFKPLYLFFYKEYLTPETLSETAGAFQHLYESIRDRNPREAQAYLRQSIDRWVDTTDAAKNEPHFT